MALVEQEPHDPWRVVLACDFVDPDGDLGQGIGILRLTAEAEAPQQVALADSFAATSGLPLTATAGRLQLLARFAPGTASGSVVHLCIQLVDAAGHASNKYRLDLRLDLENISTAI